MGCTEPIAVAYAAAKAREVLGAEPDRMIAECSGSVSRMAQEGMRATDEEILRIMVG